MRTAEPTKTHKKNDLCTIQQAHDIARHVIARDVMPLLLRLEPWYVRLWRRLRGAR
jgi:hypothetical protein